MNISPCRALSALLLAAGWLIAGPASAQNLLLLNYRGQWRTVVAAHESQPCIEIDGKVTPVYENHFGLKKVEEYLPVFIAVRHLEAQTTFLQVPGSLAKINNDFELSAEFESPFALDNVFLVLELNSSDAGKGLFIREIGRLEPRHPRTVQCQVPVTQSLGAGSFQLHLYVGGREVLHSEMDASFREAALDRMVTKRIQHAPDGPPKLFVGPIPEYPEKLAAAGVNGQVVVRARIRPSGAVAEPAVLSATAPAFGESALAAVRLWRFLPRIQDGLPVETTVDIPVRFEPPAKS